MVLRKLWDLNPNFSLKCDEKLKANLSILTSIISCLKFMNYEAINKFSNNFVFRLFSQVHIAKNWLKDLGNKNLFKVSKREFFISLTSFLNRLGEGLYNILIVRKYLL